MKGQVVVLFEIHKYLDQMRDCKDFLIKESSSELEIYFYPGEFSPDRDKLLGAINALVAKNLCTGGNLDRLMFGEVRLYFNPKYHKHRVRQAALAKIEDCIRIPNPDAMLL